MSWECSLRNRPVVGTLLCFDVVWDWFILPKSSLSIKLQLLTTVLKCGHFTYFSFLFEGIGQITVGIWEVGLQLNCSPVRINGQVDQTVTQTINKFISISSKIALRWIPQNTLDDKSTVAQVMACCCQATGQYPNQCWPQSMSHLASLQH